MISIVSEDGHHGFAPDVIINSVVLIPFLILVGIISTMILLHRKKSKSVLPFWLFLGYLYFVISLTIFPVLLFKQTSIINEFSFGLQIMFELNPLAWTKYSTLQIVGNILLLMPLPLFVGVLFKKSRSFKYSILLVLFSTVAIEIIQLVMNYFYLGNRIFDIGDVILNTTGGLLGFALLSAITPILRKTEI
ncbi:hypothetical protein FC62_GL000888 [Amylolactobacillus amylotrophicus DSM 20534]|uniref:Uncharacterized protein n=3 Tax=Amylolactobacillus TaxID=2767876 RepID=A0A1L6XBG6_9LACO|nr:MULTISPECIES: VanZ family protein [Amylolactobacillus]APT18329.1 hypothetical protein LA20533_03155 [Amylolactobacillus amylophilus DSM 20533 = JCM 1125]KRK38115.1 hypothetical protein FC62_GL000888 [Amylolactobacillus amylotrophicus DSM 20534]KRM43250.1 hypothetical protein FD40_GL000264 [Amylolactobacillus amylophilus DSM 20533 = JCM 1125]GED80910.1 antibiotic resistance protein VanZ [Amylolactobacillus amylophilus]